MPDSIPPVVKQILDLFAHDLAQATFGGLDRRVLEEARERVAAHAEAVERAEAALEAARATLAESQEVLQSRAQRALAYARVYAEDDAELSARLEAISLPRAAGPRRISLEASGPIESAPARRRGRPRAEAQSASSPALFEKPAVPAESPLAAALPQ